LPPHFDRKSRVEIKVTNVEMTPVPIDGVARPAMTTFGGILFRHPNGTNLADALRREADGLAGRVDRIAEKAFADQGDDRLAAMVVAEVTITPLDVTFDKAENDVKEETLSLPDGFGGDIRVKGFRMIKRIPFVGNQALWRLRPAEILDSLRGEIIDHTLIIEVAVPVDKVTEGKKYLHNTIKSIQAYLDHQAAQIAEHNNNLFNRILPLVRERRIRLTKKLELLKDL
jgi:hypothetical protein